MVKRVCTFGPECFGPPSRVTMWDDPPSKVYVLFKGQDALRQCNSGSFWKPIQMKIASVQSARDPDITVKRRLEAWENLRFIRTSKHSKRMWK